MKKEHINSSSYSYAVQHMIKMTFVRKRVEIYVLFCFVVLGIEPRTWSMSGKCCTTDLHP
jgi:hypothetical protein